MGEGGGGGVMGAELWVVGCVGVFWAGIWEEECALENCDAFSGPAC